MLDAPDAKLVRFFDPEVDIQNKENGDGNGESDEIEQSVPTKGATEPMQDGQERRPEAPSQMQISVDIRKVGLSIVDQRPRELVFLVMEKVEVVYATGLGENVSR